MNTISEINAATDNTPETISEDLERDKFLDFLDSLTKDAEFCKEWFHFLSGDSLILQLTELQDEYFRLKAIEQASIDYFATQDLVCICIGEEENKDCPVKLKFSLQENDERHLKELLQID